MYIFPSLKHPVITSLCLPPYSIWGIRPLSRLPFLPHCGSALFGPPTAVCIPIGGIYVLLHRAPPAGHAFKEGNTVIGIWPDAYLPFRPSQRPFPPLYTHLHTRGPTNWSSRMRPFGFGEPYPAPSIVPYMPSRPLEPAGWRGRLDCFGLRSNR